MRYYFIGALALCMTLFADRASAQRYLPGQKGIEFRGGYTDGCLNDNNFYAGVAISTYTRNRNRWVAGGEYLQKGYAYKNITIPMAQFTAEGGYYVKLLSDPSKIFFLSIGGSAMVGYETSNWGEKLLFDGASIRNKDTFIYGGAVTLELESYVTDRVIFLVNARQRALWGSTVGKFHTQFGIGFKFIIN